MNKKTALLIVFLIVAISLSTFFAWQIFQKSKTDTNERNTSTNSSASSSMLTKSQSSYTSSANSLSGSTMSNSTISLSQTSSLHSSKSSSSETSINIPEGKVRVYFTKNGSIFDYVLRDSSSTDPLDKVVDAMSAKFRGPTTEEKSMGFQKDITMNGEGKCYDTAGNLLQDLNGNPYIWTLSQKDWKVYVKMCKDVVLGGSVSDSVLQESIKKTVTDNYSGVTVVILNKDGNCLFDASGLNQCGQ
ncbi:hypothetical protein IPJ91_01420 [bacterium]|nr:MAG: hypothetical protein IPJ91_01420 [bacterium]